MYNSIPKKRRKKDMHASFLNFLQNVSFFFPPLALIYYVLITLLITTT